MKSSKKENFLELRILGKTFQEISEELKVSKQTLINWSKEKEIKKAINIAQLIKYQSILKMYEQDRISKIKYFAELLQKTKKELANCDFSDLSPDKLLRIILVSEEKLKGLITAHEFGREIDDIIFEINPSFIFDPED